MDPTLSQDDQWELSLDIDDSDLQLTQNPVRIIPGPARLVQTTNLNNENNQWEHLFLRLTLVLRPSSSILVQTPPSTQRTVRIIPGPAGIVQLVKLRKQSEIQEGGVDSVLSTQEYMKKVVEDVGDDEDFKSGSWVSATDYVNANGGIVSGCLGDIKKFLNKGKLDQVVAIVCSPNALGDLTVTMKDLPGTIPGTIHHKVIGEGGCEKDITVEVSLILANVFVFSPKPSMHYLNITKKNVVKVFRKDTVSESGSGSD
ncbi:zf-CCHC domain-containing protein [Tanacetum coccineum]